MSQVNTATGIWIVLSLFMASIEPIIAKVVYAQGVKPLDIFFVKSVTGLLFGILSYKAIKTLKREVLIKIVGLGLLLSLTGYLTLLALTEVTAVVAITFVSVTPALVALVNSVRGRDAVGPRFWLGFVMCFLGVLLSIDGLFSFSSATSFGVLGFLCLVGALISSTVYRTQLETISSSASALTISGVMFLSNGVLSLILLGPWVASQVSTVGWGTGLWIGIAAIFANIAFVKCISILGATASSIINMLQRPLVVVFAAVFLKEPMNALQWVGVVLVFCGVQMAKKVQRLGRVHS